MEQIRMQFEAGMKKMEDMVKTSCSVMKPQMATTSSSSKPLGIHEMGNNGVKLVCFFNGKLVDADRNARYIGGCRKLDTVPNMIGFTAFTEKIQQMLKLPPSDMEFKIKCGVRCDESTLIAIDVDDDESLQSIMEHSNFITAYILKNSPPSSPVVATERLFQPNFNAHHEGISLTTGTHDVNIQDKMPPSNVDAPPDSRDIDIFVGKEFWDVDALRNALSEAAIMTRRDYKPVKKTKSKLVMKCRDSSCDWHIRATRISNLPTFKVVKYQKVHTCLGHQGIDHPQATIRWIASKIWPSIQNNRDMEPKNIVKEMKNRFGIEITYNKASKAKNMALEVLYEALLPRLIKELNEGGDVANFVLDEDGSFVYLFWAFSACIQALHKNLRPILFIHESHNALGITLWARGFDGYNIYGGGVHVAFGGGVHVAFALYSGEDDMAWDTFCRCLKEYVLSDTFLSCCSDPFTVVTNYSEAAIDAVRKYLPGVHHFFWGDGLPNMLSKTYGSDVYRIFISIQCVETRSECEVYLQNMRMINEDAYDWLISLGLNHWAKAFCHAGSGLVYDFAIMFDNNFEEPMFRPRAIVDFVEHSMKVVGSYFSDRQRVGNEITTKFTPGVEDSIKEAKLDLHKQLVEVESIAINSYRVLLFGKPYVVDLERRCCTCCVFQAQEYPCWHALRVIVHECLELTEYFPRWYTAETYRATYAGKIPRISDALVEWKPATGRAPFLPKTKRRAGRPRKYLP